MIGKPGTAPCGHSGEHVVSGYVRCLEGCDAIPQHIEPENAPQAIPEHVEPETTQPYRNPRSLTDLLRYDFDSLRASVEAELRRRGLPSQKK